MTTMQQSGDLAGQGVDQPPAEQQGQYRQGHLGTVLQHHRQPGFGKIDQVVDAQVHGLLLVRIGARSASTDGKRGMNARAEARWDDQSRKLLNCSGMPNSWPRSRARSEEHTSELQSLMRISY